MSGCMFTQLCVSDVLCPFLLLQVDAGLSFTKKELENSFVFDLRTEERTWYLVAESEEDMNRWVSSICLICGFNPTEDGTTESITIDGRSKAIPSCSCGLWLSQCESLWEDGGARTCRV